MSGQDQNLNSRTTFISWLNMNRSTRQAVILFVHIPSATRQTGHLAGVAGTSLAVGLTGIAGATAAAAALQARQHAACCRARHAGVTNNGRQDHGVGVVVGEMVQATFFFTLLTL